MQTLIAVLSHSIIYDSLACIHCAAIVIFAAGRRGQNKKVILSPLTGLHSLFKLTPNSVRETTDFILIL